MAHLSSSYMNSKAGEAERKHADQSRPITAEWIQHEHVAVPLQLEAQKLLDEAGSPDLAKQAIDAAAEAQASDSPRERMARQSGFASWAELEATSIPLSQAAGNPWFAAPITGEQWIAWNQHSCEITQEFASLEDLYRYLARSE
jgi:hypothetical protein